MRELLRRHTKRVLVGLGGGLLLLVGIVMIPYPGPGWLVTFAALAVLSTEFEWAKHLLHQARTYYDTWLDWLKRQHVSVRILMVVLTGLIVILTIWVLNGYGLVDRWLDLGLNWVHSPLLK